MPLLTRQIEKIKRNAPADSTLTLWEQGLSDEDVEQLVALLLQHNTHISEINLYSNNLTDRAAIALSRLVYVEKLNLEFNNIGDAGALALARNNYIKRINLSRNCVTDDGARQVAIESQQIEFNLDGSPAIKPDSLTLLTTRLSENQAQLLRSMVGRK